MPSLYEFRIRRVKRSFAHEGKLIEPAGVAAWMGRNAVELDREHFHVIMLDGCANVVGFELVAVGGMASVEVHPREVFRAAILAGAHAIIVVHNHPSGSRMHSESDIELVQDLRRAGRVLGIEVLDSIVLAEGEYFSLAEAVGGKVGS